MVTDSKKWIAVLLIAVLAFTFITPAAFAKTPELKDLKGSVHGKAYWKIGFYDVDDSLEWARLAIDKMYAKGIFTGYGEGIFKPRNNVTHLEAIIMALRVMGWEEEARNIKTIPENVKKVKLAWSDAYYYVALAVKKGLVKPDELMGFKPNEPAKRYEVAKYIIRALGKEDEAKKHMKEKLPFKDAASIPKDAVGYVYVITQELKLMQGYNGLFKPQAPITRAEMAVLINNLDGSPETGDKNELAGVVTDIDVDGDEFSITIKNAYGEKTYGVIEGVPVYVKGRYVDLEDLKSGDKVELVLNAGGDVVFIQVIEIYEKVTVDAVGLVTDVDARDKTVSIFTYIKDDDEGIVGTLKQSNIEGKHYELDTEYGRFVLIGSTGGLEDYIDEEIVVEGEIKSSVSIYMRGDLIDVKKFYPVKTRDIVTFKVDKDTKITIDGDEAELSDIKIGDFAKVKADEDKLAMEITVKSFMERMKYHEREREQIRDGKIKGKVVSLTIRTQSEITIENDDGTYTFTLYEDVDLEDIDELADIKAGMEVELTIEDGKVTEIKAKD